MTRHNLPPNNTFNSQSEGNNWVNQQQTIFEFLQKNIATASMITAATGVPQKNICRYKRDLEQAGRLWEIVKTTCKETGFKAWYLTTDKRKAPGYLGTQLTLFNL